ncbi:MAG: hypothetical protein V4660_02155 [Pseudomonadota bacterium]
MSRLLCALGFFAITATITLITNAAPYVPKTADEIVAQWPALNDTTLQKITSPLQDNQSNTQAGDTTAIVAVANAYLAQAALPGQSRLYGLAQAVLKPAIEKSVKENKPIDKNLWLVWAQVQQHQHNFVVAQQALEKVLQQDPTNINANLLAARIYVIQENPLAARNACLKLLGSADLFTVTACSLEANTYLNPGDLGSSYQQLKQLIHSQGLPRDERGTWLIQMLADMALRNKDPSAAASWLEQRLKNASVNYLSQWADVQLELNNAAQVIQHLTQVLNNAPEMDDALLLRLALAEKKINAPERLWQSQLTERILLREQRQDNLHANEMTVYYLDINPNPVKALYWARINIVSAKEAHDKELLARAETLNHTEAPSFNKDHRDE